MTPTQTPSSESPQRSLKTSVVDFRGYKGLREAQLLVLADLHHPLPGGESGALPREALDQCRLALEHARAHEFPVAFVRRIPVLPMSAVRSYPAWLEGFEPKRADMVFDRSLPSCYASAEFADMMARTDGRFVLAGFFGEAACLATALDAFHRGHHMTYLSDASASRGIDDAAAPLAHRIIGNIISLYGDVVTTDAWVRANSRAKGGALWNVR